MKKTTLLLAFVTTLAFAPLSYGAADNEVTITGEGKCAKCELGETKECQNAIEVTKDGKTTIYYVAQNDVSKKFHKNICEEPHRVTATGTVTTENGKQVLTVTKIALAE